MCTDASVIGHAVLRHGLRQRRVFRQPHLPGVSAFDRARMYEQNGRGAGELHHVDAASSGLGDYGRPG
jgi:hypothetical protein